MIDLYFCVEMYVFFVSFKFPRWKRQYGQVRLHNSAVHNNSIEYYCEEFFVIYFYQVNVLIGKMICFFI